MCGTGENITIVSEPNFFLAAFRRTISVSLIYFITGWVTCLKSADNDFTCFKRPGGCDTC